MKPIQVSTDLPKVGVCLSPALIDQFDVSDSIVVIIDILRATTSMCVAFDHGCRSLIPVLGVEECRAYKNKGFLTAGERDGIQIDGFDMGNSPYSFMENFEGVDIAMSTTNGTKALNAAKDRNAKEIVIGSFANYNALAQYLIQRNENVLLFCSAWRDRPNLEDSIFAGAMVRRLRGRFRLHEDTALMAEALYRSANRRKRWYIRHSSHFNRLWHILQIQKDVKYALRRDTHPIIPIYKEGRLYHMDRLAKGEIDPVAIRKEYERKWSPKEAPAAEPKEEVKTPTKASN